MDPITAFQVAASVITFVEFGRVLVSSTYHLYNSPTGQTAEIIKLSTLRNDLELAQRQIDTTIAEFPATEADHDMLQLCEQCREIGAVLLSTVDSLTARGDTAINYAKRSFVVAAKGLWKAGQVASLKEQLETIRSRIILNILVSLWYVHALAVLLVKHQFSMSAMYVGVIQKELLRPTHKFCLNSMPSMRRSTKR